ncbi:MAG TPA: glucosidase [Aestuariivirga sp.]
MKTETGSALNAQLMKTAEGQRLSSSVASDAPWRQWGPYLSERQWGTVREDYSADGSAWEYFPHDHARSRAYRWGEDGLGGFGDNKLNLCMNVALWNGHDPILKERLFGLTNAQGNHGEDVKELYYYLDGLPSHAYMKMLYKYPHAAFPYDDLVKTNATRSLTETEYELVDTGIFKDNRYFDVEIEYAKAAADNILLQITVHNRGPDEAKIHILPQIWFRNQWSWESGGTKPSLTVAASQSVNVNHPALPAMQWACDQSADLIFCENDTNTNRLYGTQTTAFFKDGINNAVVNGQASVNPSQTGTKAAAHCICLIPAGGSKIIRIRLSQISAKSSFADFDSVMVQRRNETNEFYAVLQTGLKDPDKCLVQRQALAGMLWCKQYYGYDVRRWLEGDPLQPPPPPERAAIRNANWGHLVLGDSMRSDIGNIISMPDSWEYPWFAAWDLAFHCVTLALIDPAFAKSQLALLTQARSLHPNGQVPAYEWNFSDVNPPVQAWAALNIFEADRKATGVGDTAFLERVFHKLLLNFTWWVNREDSMGRNIFQGGFLGFDNIGLFDLRKPLPGDGHLDQVDGTAWVATFSLNMMRIALVLSQTNRVYVDLATKFLEHFLYISEAIHSTTGPTPTGLWDDQDEFYYDVLHIDGEAPHTMRIRSLAGLIPLFAVEVLDGDFLKAFPDFMARLDWFITHRPDLASLVSDWRMPNKQGYRLMSLMRKHRLNAVLTRILDETEFLSDYGVRSLSKYHQKNPYSFTRDGETMSLHYEPGEGETRVYGGNSNWRGPIWMPGNFMIIDSLRKFDLYYGADFEIECPKGSGKMLSLAQVADELMARLQKLFLKDNDGTRIASSDSGGQMSAPQISDLPLFHEYFHGDTGRGLGASHQTGWTGLIALLLQPKT